MTTSQNKLDFQAIFIVPLRQFVWWLIMVLLITFAGYPGVVCVTPMAWLIALRVGNLIIRTSKSERRSQRLTESALAGALLGLLQGLLFAVIVPLMGPIQVDEKVISVILTAFILIVGILVGAVLSFVTTYVNENRRKQIL